MKKIIKIIDLLNLVYEKKAPKFVIYDNNKYEYDPELNDYKFINESYLFAILFEREAKALSKTVEIPAEAVNYLLEKSDKSE